MSSAAGSLVLVGANGQLTTVLLGTNLSIVDGALVAAGGSSGGGGYPSLSAPTEFSVNGSGTASLTISFATGYSLPTITKQASWDAAAENARPPLYAITTTYTASGAISPTDRVAVINTANAVSMTLASGSSNGQSLLIKRTGSGAVTITANMDGVSGASIVADSATIKESVLLAWSSSLATWLIL
jgi:hypothetical protein